MSARLLTLAGRAWLAALASHYLVEPCFCRHGDEPAGQTIGVRFTEEQRQFRIARVPFAAETTTIATVSTRALVHWDGAVYSVPCRRTGLDLVVQVRATTVTIVGRDGQIQHPQAVRSTVQVQ